MVLLAVPLKNDSGLESPVNNHFSRSPYFLLYDTATGDNKVLENGAARGAGHDGPLNLLYDNGVRSVACSGIGPGAMDYAAELGITICFGRAQKAQDLVDKYMGGTLENMADGSLCGGD